MHQQIFTKVTLEQYGKSTRCKRSLDEINLVVP